MNILGPITADFVQRMKANAPKGWSITPLVTNDFFVGHGGLLPVLPPPAGTSPHDHFMQQMAQTPTLLNGKPALRECYVKVKVPHKPLRLVKLSPVPESHVTGGHARKIQEQNEGKNVLYVSYWRANGWVRDQHSHQRFTGKYPRVPDDFPPPGHDTLLVHGIIRVNKNNRKKSALLLYDCLNLSSTDEYEDTVKTAVGVIEKSWTIRRETFRAHEQYLMIDLEGRTYYNEHHNLPWRT